MRVAELEPTQTCEEAKKITQTAETCKEIVDKFKSKKEEEHETLSLESPLKEVQNNEQTKDCDERDTIVKMIAKLTFSPQRKSSIATEESKVFLSPTQNEPTAQDDTNIIIKTAQIISLDDESSMLLDDEPNLNQDLRRSENARVTNETETTAAASSNFVSSPPKAGAKTDVVQRSIQSDYLIRQARKKTSEITEQIQFPNITTHPIMDDNRMEQKSKIKKLEARIDD